MMRRDLIVKHGLHYDAGDIERFIASPDVRVYDMELVDRYGSNGITGLIIAKMNGRTAEIDTFLLSCRVIGRNVERAFFAYVVDDLSGMGISDITAEYIPTPRNARNNQATRQARKYVEEQMMVLKKDLAEANTSLSEYKRKTGLIAPDEQLGNLASHIAQLHLDNDAAKAELAATRRKANALEGELGAQQDKVIESSTITRNPQFATAKDWDNAAAAPQNVPEPDGGISSPGPCGG